MSYYHARKFSRLCDGPFVDVWLPADAVPAAGLFVFHPLGGVHVGLCCVNREDPVHEQAGGPVLEKWVHLKRIDGTPAKALPVARPRGLGDSLHNAVVKATGGKRKPCGLCKKVEKVLNWVGSYSRESAD